MGARGAAAQPVPLGPEIRVDTLAGDQFPSSPVLAVQPGGGFEIAWGYGASQPAQIFSRHFTAGGEPTDAAQVLIGSRGYYPLADAVTATPKGFDVLWHVVNDLRPEAPAFYRRHLNLQGVPDPGKPAPLGGKGTQWVWNVRGNGFMAGSPLLHAHGIAARHLASSGRPTGPELRLNSRAVDEPDTIVTAVADGGFVAIWFGTVPVRGSTPRAVLRARRFSPAGKPLGPDFDVNTIVPGEGGTVPFLRSGFAVAAAPDGGFAVSWILTDTLYLRFFDAAARPLGPEVAAVTTDDTIAPESMAFDPAGNLLVLWLVLLQDPFRTDVQIQLFDPHGAPLGPQAGVSSAASDRYHQPFRGSVEWAGDSWLIAWAAQVEDLEPSAIFVRRFAGN
jgi:hypothetical protein